MASAIRPNEAIADSANQKKEARRPCPQALLAQATQYATRIARSPLLRKSIRKSVPSLAQVVRADRSFETASSIGKCVKLDYEAIHPFQSKIFIICTIYFDCFRMSSTPPKTSQQSTTSIRIDPLIEPTLLWTAMSQSPGIGVSITDVDGRLLFVNDTTMVLFSEQTNVDYVGKCIADFHPPEFVAERLAMLRKVVEESKTVRVRHVYHGRRIESTLWPVKDKRPPFNRVIVVTHQSTYENGLPIDTSCIETVSTNYIDLGSLNVLSRRELEVLVLLGHGLSVPRTAAVLHRSPKTIQRHKASISEKLGLRGQAEIVQIVTELGLELSDTHLKRY